MTNHQGEMPINLAVVPDFTADITPDAIQSSFIAAARSIILEHELKRGVYRWDIMALELYLYRRGILEDKATHGVKFGTREQLKRGTWYIHRRGALPPMRWGIDITAGSYNPEIHAGLLIAAIGDMNGSGRAVKTILRGHWTIGDWVYPEDERKFLLNDIDTKSICANPPNLRLIKSSPKQGPLWIGHRKIPSGDLQSRELRVQHDRLTGFPEGRGRQI